MVQSKTHSLKSQLVNYYEDVVRKPIYWLPILIFSVAAFGFSLFSGSVSTDDLNCLSADYYHKFRGPRWGMLLWDYLAGLSLYSPFLDELLALLYLQLSAIGIGFIFYSFAHDKDVVGYTLLSSILITFPLIVEIWNYNGANFYYTGGLLLVTISLIVFFNARIAIWRKVIICSALLVLPASSYEASIFTYLTLFTIIIFYKYVVVEDTIPSFHTISILFVYALIPVFVAVAVKFAVPIIYNQIFNFSYKSFGQTDIGWFNGGDIIHRITATVFLNFFFYILVAVIYLPIKEFFICTCFLGGYSIVRAIKKKNAFPIVWGIVVMVSIFSQAILQGALMPYRTAQGVSILVAFVAFLIFNVVLRQNVKWMTLGTTVLLIFLCWHQSAFIHKIQSLNVLRSECESAIIHDIGRRLMSDYEKKPVVVVSACSLSPWIEEQVHINSHSVNGKLFLALCSKFGVSPDIVEHWKIVRNNVNPFVSSHDIRTVMWIFQYYGYNVEIIQDPIIISQAESVAKELKMRPFQIFDYGPYLIVQISGTSYYM